MSVFTKSNWKWGDEPPAWVMKEFKKALHLMGKNKEAIHIIQVGPDWSFVIAISSAKEVETTMEILTTALSGMKIDSEKYFPNAPRHAVHGDLYP